MSSIFKIISQYQGRLVIFPILTLIFVLSTCIFFLIDRGRKTKYLPALIGIIAGIILLVIGSGRFTRLSGLKLVWFGLATFTAACIGLATAWLLTIFSAFSADGRIKSVPVRRPSNRRRKVIRKADETRNNSSGKN